MQYSESYHDSEYCVWYYCHYIEYANCVCTYILLHVTRHVIFICIRTSGLGDIYWSAVADGDAS